MKYQKKTKKQLINELMELRQQINELGALEKEHMRAEEALKVSEEKYRILVENINDVIFSLDAQGCFTYISPAIEWLGHYTVGEVIGKHFSHFVHFDDLPGLQARFERTLNGSLEPYDFRVFEKDGTIHHMRTSSRPLLENGRLVGLTGLMTDITERKQVEEALRENEHKLSTILQGSPIPAFVIGKDHKVMYWNKALEEMSGIKAEEIMGTGQHWKAFYDENRPCLADLLVDEEIDAFPQWYGDKYTKSKLIEGAYEATDFFPALSEGGRWLRFTAAIIKDSTGNLIGALESLEDITERKRSEETLRQSEQSKTILNQIATIFLTIPDEEMYGEVLSVVLQAMKSKYGIFGYIGDSGEFIMPSLTREVWGECKVPGKSIVFPSDTWGESLWGRAINEKKAFYSDGPFRTPEGHVYIDNFLAVPIVFGKETIGLLSVANKEGGYTEEDKELQESIANFVSPILNARLQRDRQERERRRAEETLQRSEEKTKRLAQENAIMAEIGRIISSTLKVEEVYERFVEEVHKLIAFDRISVNIINPEENTVTPAYVSGEKVAGREMGDVFPLNGSFTEEVIRARAGLLVQEEKDTEKMKNWLPSLLTIFQAGLRSMVAVPLISKDQVIGTLHIQSLTPNAYTEPDMNLAEKVGNQIAGAIANAQLFARHERSEIEKIALQEEFRQSQKMEAIGRLAGGIAHDFNNIMTVIGGHCELSLLKLIEGDPLRGNIEEIKKASVRAASLTRQLLAFSRRQILEFNILNLNAILLDLNKMLRRIIGEDVELVTILGEDLGRVKTDSSQIEQVILNLAVNARDAMPNGGKLILETANVELDEGYARSHVAVTPGSYVRLSVSDTGVGMSPEVKEHIFEPFFTTKEKGKGTGLGLSTVYGIVKQSGGNIWVYSELGHGTAFKIYLPRVDEPVKVLGEREEGGEIPRGRETILLAEDEGTVRELAAVFLRRQGYTVLEGRHGDDALLIYMQHKGSIDLLLTDVVMPGMNGRELADWLRSFHSEMKVLYMSGYTDNAIVHHGVLIEGMNYIQKPFTLKGLAKKVREVLDKA